MDNNKNNYKVPEGMHGEKSPVYLSLCLGKIVDGLHADLALFTDDNPSFLTLVLHHEPIAFFPVAWAKHINPEDGLLELQSELVDCEDPSEPVVECHAKD